MRRREERSVQRAMELYRERLAPTTGSSSIPDTIRSSCRPREQCRHVLRAVADRTDKTATICKSVIRLPGSVRRRRPRSVRAHCTARPHSKAVGVTTRDNEFQWLRGHHKDRVTFDWTSGPGHALLGARGVCPASSPVGSTQSLEPGMMTDKIYQTTDWLRPSAT
jgi:hypothetical protein